MPKLVKPLTEAKIRNAKPRDKSYKLHDGNGLTLLIRPSGTKTWQHRYIINGKSNVYSIGKYDILSTKEARRRVYEIKEMVSEGIDPNQKKRQRRLNNLKNTANTFEMVAREWFEKQSWVPSHTKTIQNRLDKDVFPNIGRKPINSVTVPEIVKILQDIEDRGAPDVAKRVGNYCTRIFE